MLLTPPHWNPPVGCPFHRYIMQRCINILENDPLLPLTLIGQPLIENENFLTIA